MNAYRISTREEYDYALKRGYDALHDERFALPIALRKSIQKERFGGNDEEGNEKFYRYCIEAFPHVCEECGKPIRHPSAFNVSHILTRGAHPDKAHDPRNINILCVECHARWENGNRETMRIFARNQRTIQKLKQEYDWKEEN